MRTRISALLVVVLVSVLAPAGKARAEAPAVPRSAPATCAQLPLRFEPNTGQTDPDVHYVAHGDGYAVFVTDDGVTLSMRSSSGRAETLRMSIAGAGSRPRVTAERLLPGKVNDLRGNDPSTWRRDVPTYAAVRVEGLSGGLETVFYGTEVRLEYDFVVAPGADPDQLRVRFEGQNATTFAEDGSIVLSLRDGDVRHHRPVVYQDGPAGRNLVAAWCMPGVGGEIRFDFGAYDPSLPLVVDPVIEFGTYLGGGIDKSSPKAVAVDSAGAVYVAGTSQTEPPSAFEGHADAFVSKLTRDGSSVLYTTYIGGTSSDSLSGLAIDATGAAVIVGKTDSFDFPATEGAFDREYSLGDVFVAKLSSDGGNVVFATFLGGSYYEEAAGVTVDATGAVYVTGSTGSADFPTTPGAFDRTLDGLTDAFVVKLSSDGSMLVYSTLVGGSSHDSGKDVAVDQTGAAYIAGETSSGDFPATPGAFDTVFTGETFSDRNVFAAKLNTRGTALLYATYLGGGGFLVCTAVAIAPGRVAVVAGYTNSADYPTTLGAFDRTFEGTSDAFVTAVAADGRSLVYSTLVGGAGGDAATGLTVHASGAVYLAGNTTSSDFPVMPGALEPVCEEEFGGEPAFLVKLALDGSALDSSTCLGLLASPMVAVDTAGVAHVLGRAGSSEYPTTPGAYSRDFHPDAIALTGIASDGRSRVYSTFVDEPTYLFGFDRVAVDSDGAVYVASTDTSFRYPTSPGAYDQMLGGLTDVVVTKLSPGGSLVYSTFLGGASYDGAGGITVNSAGEAYLTGGSGSEDFPTTPGAYDTAMSGGSAAFVVRLAADGGSLVYSTFFGGNRGDFGSAIVLRPNGAVYVAGATTSLDFPTTPGAPDTAENGFGDAFVVKLNPTGTQLKRSTLFGGLTTERAPGLTFDRTGVTLVGIRGDYSDEGGGDSAGYVVKFNKQLTAIVFSKELVNQSLFGVASGATGAVYVCGTAYEGFLTTPGAFDRELGGSSDAFVMKLTPDGSLVYATMLGGAGLDFAGVGIAVDATGAVVVAGTTYSSDIPVTVGALDHQLDGMSDAFVATIAPDGATVTFATYLGGTRNEFAEGLVLGPSGAVYLSGKTSSPDFPAAGHGLRGRSNVFVLKLSGHE